MLNRNIIPLEQVELFNLWFAEVCPGRRAGPGVPELVWAVTRYRPAALGQHLTPRGWELALTG
jgi:hypothetical protein